jgi:hypothetical protein
MKSDKKDNEKSGGNYPYAPLAICLPVADEVKSLGGRSTPVSKSLLASSLKEDEKSQTLTFKLASAKSYGLIEGRSDFSLTEIANRYYFPTSESDQKNALLDFLEYPPAFKKLVERFDGSRLPPTEILGNILHTELGVPVSWKDRVAVFFVKSAEFVAATDAQGHLRVKASRDGRGSSPAAKDAASVATMPKREPVEISRSDSPIDFLSDVWTFSYRGKTVRLETPTEIEMPLWLKLNAYIQVLKPETEKNNE